MAGHARGDEAKEAQHVSISGKDLRGVVYEPERTFLAEGLGKELRRLRTRAGLKQSDVARLCGMVEETVQRFETGHRRPTIHALGTLARMLAPADSENAVMAKLVELAGDSARTGAERKRYLASNLRTRNTMALLDRDREKLRKLVAEYTARGRPVPAHISETLEAFAKHMDALRQRVLPELPEVSGESPAPQSWATYRLPTGMKALEAHYASQGRGGGGANAN